MFLFYYHMKTAPSLELWTDEIVIYFNKRKGKVSVFVAEQLQ